MRFAVLNPKSITTLGLASFPFARRYSENLFWFLFLRLLRCFSSAGLPTCNYLFITGWQSIALPGFPIRKSAGLCLFAAIRSLSQLVTSFFGSWCQGILHVLFFAWPSSKQTPFRSPSMLPMQAFALFVASPLSHKSIAFMGALKSKCLLLLSRFSLEQSLVLLAIILWVSLFCFSLVFENSFYSQLPLMHSLASRVLSEKTWYSRIFLTLLFILFSNSFSTKKWWLKSRQWKSLFTASQLYRP